MHDAKSQHACCLTRARIYFVALALHMFVHMVVAGAVQEKHTVCSAFGQSVVTRLLRTAAFQPKQPNSMLNEHHAPHTQTINIALITCLTPVTHHVVVRLSQQPYIRHTFLVGST
jgi:hypothetical protein